jgi:hypothetical protein
MSRKAPVRTLSANILVICGIASLPRKVANMCARVGSVSLSTRASLAFRLSSCSRKFGRTLSCSPPHARPSLPSPTAYASGGPSCPHRRPTRREALAALIDDPCIGRPSLPSPTTHVPGGRALAAPGELSSLWRGAEAFVFSFFI